MRKQKTDPSRYRLSINLRLRRYCRHLSHELYLRAELSKLSRRRFSSRLAMLIRIDIEVLERDDISIRISVLISG